MANTDDLTRCNLRRRPERQHGPLRGDAALHREQPLVPARPAHRGHRPLLAPARDRQRARLHPRAAGGQGPAPARRQLQHQLQQPGPRGCGDHQGAGDAVHGAARGPGGAAVPAGAGVLPLAARGPAQLHRRGEEGGLPGRHEELPHQPQRGPRLRGLLAVPGRGRGLLPRPRPQLRSHRRARDHGGLHRVHCLGGGLHHLLRHLLLRGEDPGLVQEGPRPAAGHLLLLLLVADAGGDGGAPLLRPAALRVHHRRERGQLRVHAAHAGAGHRGGLPRGRGRGVGGDDLLLDPGGHHLPRHVLLQEYRLRLDELDHGGGPRGQRPLRPQHQGEVQ